jgi:hypothetical protein
MASIKSIEKHPISRNEILALSQNAIMSRLNCHNVGRIIDFDKNTQTCTVELMQLKQFTDEILIPAPLTDVPLIIYGAGDATITMPNPVGSTCLILFLDRNIDAFMQTGEQYVPDTARMHDFTDCVALTTFRTMVNPIDNYDETSISINYQQIVNEILYQAAIKNFGNSINLKVENDLNTTQINIADRVKIQNTAQNLLVLITALINTIKAITITNNAISQTSRDALDAITTQFGELLE